MWQAELHAIRRFSAEFARKPPLPSASTADLEWHAHHIQEFHQVLSLIATLPRDKRPSIPEWDDTLAALWRLFVKKGDDIDRYITTRLWIPVLADEGPSCASRLVRAITATVGSCRNFYLYDEALGLCAEGRRLAKGLDSGALAALISAEASTRYCMGDFEGAEQLYREALGLADRLPTEETEKWVLASKSDLIVQCKLNIMETLLERGLQEDEAARRALGQSVERLIAEVEFADPSPGFARYLTIPRAELALLRGDFQGATRHLEGLTEDSIADGPYGFSLRPTHRRLMSRVCAEQGDLAGAQRWIREALRDGLCILFPAEEQMIVGQALSILRGLHASRGSKRQASLLNDMVALLEDKDWYTGRSHSRSVANLSKKLARLINETHDAGLDEKRLFRAGLVHDIGKLRCPWSLLNKIAPINRTELELLRRHSTQGRDILIEVGMEDLAGIVLEHHETMDGRGYPDGKPPSLEGAVVALCDVYEAAITPNRRYKRPKKRAEVMGELKELAGTTYHPWAVEALCQASGTSFSS